MKTRPGNPETGADRDAPGARLRLEAWPERGPRGFRVVDAEGRTRGALEVLGDAGLLDVVIALIPLPGSTPDRSADRISGAPAPWTAERLRSAVRPWVDAGWSVEDEPDEVTVVRDGRLVPALEMVVSRTIALAELETWIDWARRTEARGEPPSVRASASAA